MWQIGEQSVRHPQVAVRRVAISSVTGKETIVLEVMWRSGTGVCAPEPPCRGRAKRGKKRAATGSPSLTTMSLEWEQTIINAREPAALGRWWREALGWVVVNDEPDEFEIRPAADRLPGLLFVTVPEPKTVTNRLHFDFRPDDRDREVERMLALGATRADVGQGEVSWVVLADPEGNEFCILRAADKAASS